MKKYFTFKDNKSDKFWSIDYSGNDFTVNYGKTGAIGKYEIKEFESEEACKKEAEKLISQKIKKGYKEIEHYNFDERIYIDDEEMGQNKKTSHPNFVKYFSDDLYYSEDDEETPFGSDEGNDTLKFIFEGIRKNKDFDFYGYPQKLIEEEWEMKYIPADMVSKEETEKLIKEEDGKMNVMQSDMITYAVAFAQIKITGKVDSRLKERALNAIKRFMSANEMEHSEIGDKMIEDLKKFEIYSDK